MKEKTKTTPKKAKPLTDQQILDKLLDSVNQYKAVNEEDFQHNETVQRLVFKTMGFLIKRDSSR